MLRMEKEQFPVPPSRWTRSSLNLPGGNGVPECTRTATHRGPALSWAKFQQSSSQLHNSVRSLCTDTEKKNAHVSPGKAYLVASYLYDVLGPRRARVLASNRGALPDSLHCTPGTAFRPCEGPTHVLKSY